MDRELLSLPWYLTRDFTRVRHSTPRLPVVALMELLSPRADGLGHALASEAAKYAPGLRGKLPDSHVDHLEDAHRAWLPAKGAHPRFNAWTFVFFTASAAFFAIAAISLLMVGQSKAGLTLAFCAIGLGLVGWHSAAAAIRSYRLRELDEAGWKHLEAALLSLLLAADDNAKVHAGRTPEELGRSRPDEYLGRAEDIEHTYRAPENPVAQPRKREWISSYVSTYMHDRSDLARLPRPEIESRLKLLWEADHLALLAAKQVPLATAPEPAPTPVEIAREILEHNRGLDDLLKEYDARFDEDLAAKSKAMLVADGNEQSVERYARTARAKHDADRRDVLREVQAELARRRKPAERDEK